MALSAPPMLRIDETVEEPLTASALEVAPPVTERFRAATRPVLSMLNSVVVAVAVEEPMANNKVFVSVARAWIESLAKGLVEPRPRLPNGVNLATSVLFV